MLYRKHKDKAKLEALQGEIASIPSLLYDVLKAQVISEDADVKNAILNSRKNIENNVALCVAK